MLISYCTTCMGRLWQLRQTLPEHLRLFAGRRNVELVLLDYNSPDGLEDWVRRTPLVRAAVETGLLLYAKVAGVTQFSSPKAKNLAHRLARGEMLFNLDADNWAFDLDPALRLAFSQDAVTVFHGHNPRMDGTFGRLGLSRDWFHRLGGYDESFAPMAYQDQDLLDRALAAGLGRTRFANGRAPIANTARDKVANTGAFQCWKAMLEANRRLSTERIARGECVANARGWGSAVVSVNFGPPVEFAPIRPELAAPLRSSAPGAAGQTVTYTASPVRSGALAPGQQRRQYVRFIQTPALMKGP